MCGTLVISQQQALDHRPSKARFEMSSLNLKASATIRDQITGKLSRSGGLPTVAVASELESLSGLMKLRGFAVPG